MRRLAVLLVVFGGCGDGKVTADGSLAPGDRAGGLVSIQFLSDLAFPGDQTVYFQNADSSLVLAGRTSADGRANAFMAPGGNVTLVVTRANLVALYTQMDVQPGDELVIDERTSSLNAGTRLQIRVPRDPSSTFYDLTTSCGSADIRGAESAPVPVFLTDCGARADMLVRSFGDGVGYIYRAGVEIEPDVTVTFAGPYHPFVPTTIVATGIEPTLGELHVAYALISGGRELHREDASISPATGATTVQAPIPVDGFAMIRIDPSPSGALADHHVIEWGPSKQANVVDVSAALRPILERPRIDLAQQAVVWTESSTGLVPDAVLATFQWSPEGSFRNYQWTVVAPRTEEAILRLPILPRDELVPQGILIDPYVFATISSDGGFDRIRPRILGAWSPGRMWPTDGSAGRVMYRALVP